MKLFYLTALDDLDRNKCGILGKINGQINAFEKKGIKVSFGHFHGLDQFVILYEGKEIKLAVNGSTTRDRLGAIYDDVKSYILENGIKVLYIRFSSLDSRAIHFYQFLHNEGIMIIIEFYSHNLELEAKKTAIRDFKSGYYTQAIKGIISLYMNKFYFLKLKECVDLIVTTTFVGDMYGVHTLNVVNGIDIDQVNARKKQSNQYDLNIISVAMISPWHGYDRVIKGIAEYYKNGGRMNIMYNVIGDGEGKAELEQMVIDLNLQGHVVFPGIKLAEELNQYYDYADISIEMLAGFRRTNGQISSIKMAEYFAKGIPVVYAADKPLYLPEMEKYCLRVSNDDSSIDIEKMISFCNDVYKEDNVELAMHELAKKEFDWLITSRKLHDYILDNGSKSFE